MQRRQLDKIATADCAKFYRGFSNLQLQHENKETCEHFIYLDVQILGLFEFLW